LLIFADDAGAFHADDAQFDDAMAVVG